MVTDNWNRITSINFITCGVKFSRIESIYCSQSRSPFVSLSIYLLIIYSIYTFHLWRQILKNLVNILLSIKITICLFINLSNYYLFYLYIYHLWRQILKNWVKILVAIKVRKFLLLCWVLLQCGLKIWFQNVANFAILRAIIKKNTNKI